MGSQISDLYQLEDIRMLQQKDLPSLLYIWLDLNVANQQNHINSKIFQEYLSIVELDSFQKLAKEVDRAPVPQRRIRVISAASLPQQNYRYMQDNAKIQRIILFCRNNARANNLQRDYPKIKNACFGPGDVINIIRLWEKQEERNFIVFQEETIETINKLYSNILSLTDDRHILMSQAKKHFHLYCQKFITGDLSKLESLIQEFERLRNDESVFLSFIEKQFVGDSLLANIVNNLLVCTFNPKKLAYLRYIINGIFHAMIKCDTSRYQGFPKAYYSRITVSESQLQKIRDHQNKHIMFTHFLQGTMRLHSQAPLDHQIMLKIHIPESNILSSNGYLINGNEICFNLGNYFKIIHYDSKSKQLQISLLQFQENIEIDLQNEVHSIYLNRLYQMSEHKRYEGQWLSLLLNQTESVSNEYIKALLAQKNIGEGIVFRYRFNNFRYKFKKNIFPEQFQAASSKLEEEHLQKQEQFVKSLCLACEYYWDNRNSSKVEEYMKKLKRLQVFIKEEDLESRYKLLRHGFDIDQSNSQKELSRAMQALGNIQLSLKRSNPYSSVQTYILLLKVKLRGYFEAGSIRQQLSTINKLLQIYCVCEGRTHPQFMRFTMLKIEIISNRDKEINLRECAYKAKLFASSISFDTLKQSPIPQTYAVSLGSVDLSFYT